MSSIYSRLITFILEHEGDNWFSAREFAEKYQLNYHTTRKYLEELADTGYLQRMKQGKLTYYKLINPHKLSEFEKELARKDMLRTYVEKIKKLTEENRKLRFLVSQYKNLIDEEELRRMPDDPVIDLSTPKTKKDRIELFVDILHEIWTRKNLIRVKNKPEPF